MEILLSVAGENADAIVEVTLRPGATIGELADALAVRCGRAPGGDGRPGGASGHTLAVTPKSRGPHAAAWLAPRDLDVEASGLSSGDHVDIVAAASAPGWHAQERVLVEVTAGPDAGASFALGPGSHLIGSGGRCAVRLSDPLVSAHHARLVVDSVIELIDLGSTTGVRVGDTAVLRATVKAKQTITLGATALSVTAAPVVALPAPRDSHVHTRMPRVLPQVPTGEPQRLRYPRHPEARSLPRVALIGPVVLGLALFAMTGRALSLIFVAMGPLMLVGGIADSRRTAKLKRESALTAFALRLESLDIDLKERRRREREAARSRFPEPDVVACALSERTPILWSRRPEHDEFASFRIGRCTEPFDTHIDLDEAAGEGSTDPIEEAVASARALDERHRVIEGMPATVSLRWSGSCGIAGGDARDTARAAILHLAALHAPGELALAAVVDNDSAEWEWMLWLPHTRSATRLLGVDAVAGAASRVMNVIDALESVIESRSRVSIEGLVPRLRGHDQGTDQQPPVVPSIVLLVDSAADAARERIIRIAEVGPDVGVHVMWVAPRADDVPAACRTLVDLGAQSGGGIGHVRSGEARELTAADSVGRALAEQRARQLAPVRDAGHVDARTSQVPARLGIGDLHGPDIAHAARHASAWSLARAARGAGTLAGHGLRALVGHTGSEPFYLDLSADGPHALVAGTTGAGKSEFLQTWLLALAAVHSPRRLTFLLVDYKGGAAFAECVNLPHCVGLVTDLSPALVVRALHSLRAELKYRERLLAHNGFKDLASFEAADEEKAPARLVIVVDEFAALASEVPAFVDGVVDIAQRGRSLGLHLIMATQRPAGVIKDNVRANTSMRIALRLADEADSKDVIGAADAARIGKEHPGRAVAKGAGSTLVAFQSAFSSGHSLSPLRVPSGGDAGVTRGGSVEGVTADAAPRAVALREIAIDGHPRLAFPVDPRDGNQGDVAADARGPSDAALIVASMNSAAERLGLPAPRKPWLAELGPHVDLDSLETSSVAAAFALADDPHAQRQCAATYAPGTEGLWIVVGGPGSGKSTALRAITLAVTRAALLHQGAGRPLEVAAIDASRGGLDLIGSLPHVGDIVAADDLERLTRLLASLAARARSGSSAGLGAGSSAGLGAGLAVGASQGTGTGAENVLVAIDGLDRLVTALSEPGSASMMSDLIEIVRSGRQAGIHVIASVDRWGALPSAIQAHAVRTIVLRLADEQQYALAGLRGAMLAADAPPGRGFDTSLGCEIQVGVPGGSSLEQAQAASIAELAALVHAKGGWEALPVPRLPDLVPASEIAAAVGGKCVVGVEARTLDALAVRADRHIVIAGHAGSGRTNAVRWLAVAALAARPRARLVRIAPRVAEPWGTGIESYTGPAAAAEAAAALAEALACEAAADGGVILCIESVGDFAGVRGELELLACVKDARRNGHLVLGEAETSQWLGAIAGELRSSKRGLILNPDQADSQVLFGVHASRSVKEQVPAGRGIWVEAGKAVVVQVPLWTTSPPPFEEVLSAS